jgi:twitching motility protein PilT
VTSPIATVVISDAMHAAHARRASDLHLQPALPPILRVDGRLQPWDGPRLSRDDLDALERDLLNEEARGVLRMRGDVTTTINNDGTPVRVHTQRIAGGTAFALRFLRAEVPTFGELGLPQVVAELVYRPHGLVIFAGSTGSGKSTTLAALIELMNREMRRKIVTIEDPIEYTIASKDSLIVQRQVGRDVTSFADAVVGALRSDPDVIVIGEMRDSATVRAALGAAETGHLVLGTLHGSGAAQCIDRLIDGFAGSDEAAVRGRLAQALLGVVTQRLIDRAGGRGRRPATEILVVTDAVRHMIRDGRQHQLPTVMTTGRQFGMQTLEMHVSELVASGEIDAAAAERAVR